MHNQYNNNTGVWNKGTSTKPSNKPQEFSCFCYFILKSQLVLVIFPSEHCSLNSVQWTVLTESVHWTVFTEHCSLNSVQKWQNCYGGLEKVAKQWFCLWVRQKAYSFLKICKWRYFNKDVILIPAMNVRMWLHKATQNNLKNLQDYGYKFIGPINGEMACG